MSDPFSEMPGMPRPTRRRFEPGLVQEGLRALKDTLRPAGSKARYATRRAARSAMEGFRRTQRLAMKGLHRAQEYGQNLWRQGQRKPRVVGVIAAAAALTLVGAYALNASGRSLCPPVTKGKTPKFHVLMDAVPQAAAGSEVEINYDVCGLASGSAYSGRVRLIQSQQQPAGKKNKKRSAKPTPLVVTFKDRVDGPATRREQELKLGSTKPGTYTLELTVTDSKGRERKKVQKVVVKR